MWGIIMRSYNLESSDLPSPLGVKAYSSQGMAASKAFPVLQCCRVVYAPHIRQVLDKDLRLAKNSWLFVSLSIAVLFHTKQGFASLAA